MRPDIHFDSYKRYKNGTNEIARWLATTAQEHGIAFQKAEKKTYILPLAEFSRLAIALSTESKIVVPKAVVDHLKEVLSLRKEATQYFQNQNTADKLFQRGNENHLYVITVLEGVLETLSPLGEKKTRSDDQEDKAERNKVPSNLFDALELQVTEDIIPSLELVQPSTVPRPTQPISKVFYEAQISDSELLFALFCFFNDLNDIRQFLRETWEQYKQGEISVMSASVTTDMAFEMVRQKEQGFRDTISLPRDRNLRYLGEILFDFRVHPMMSAGNAHGLPGEACHQSFYSLAEFVYLPNYLHLRKVCNLVKDVEDSAELAESFLRTASNKQRFEKAGKILDTAAFTMYVLQMHCGTVVTGTLVDGISDLMNQNYDKGRPGKKSKTKKDLDLNDIPSWLCFASQIFLDVHELLGDDNVRAFRDLKSTGHRALGMVTRHFAFHDGRYESSWPAPMDEAVEEIRHMVNTFINQDEFNMTPEETGSRHAFLCLHPIWCGLVTFQINKSLETLGMHCANTWTTLIPGMYLYNAAKSECKIPDWPDMEYLINYHDPTYLFVGGRTGASAAHFNKLMIALGLSAEHFAKENRGKRVITSRGFAKGARYLRQNILVSHSLGWNYRCLGANIDLEKEPSLMAILMAFARKPTTALVRAKELSFPTSVQLLASLRDGLNVEIEHILFDYFSMHRRCFKLCYALQSGLRENIAFVSRIVPQDYAQEELVRQIPTLVLQMEHESARINTKGNLFAMLKPAVPIVEDLIKREGDREIKRMRSVGADIEDLTTDIAKLMRPDAQASEFLSAENGSLNIVDIMEQMSASTGANHDEVQLMHDTANRMRQAPGMPTMKDSQENGIREINELLVSMGRKANAAELMKQDPMGLMKLIMSEEIGGSSSSIAGEDTAMYMEEDEETRERRQRKNRARNEKRRQKKRAVDSGNGSAEVDT